MNSRGIVRPNRYDSRERRLENDIRRLVRAARERHPEVFDGNSRIVNLSLQTAVRMAEQELDQPMGSDLEGRVRSPLIRWWRNVRTAKYNKR